MSIIPYLPRTVNILVPNNPTQDPHQPPHTFQFLLIFLPYLSLTEHLLYPRPRSVITAPHPVVWLNRLLCVWIIMLSIACRRSYISVASLNRSKAKVTCFQVSLLTPPRRRLRAHHAVVTKLISFLFALMGANEELEVVSPQHSLRHIRPPVAASTSHLVGNAAILGHWVTPQHVHYLCGRKIRH